MIVESKKKRMQRSKTEAGPFVDRHPFGSKTGHLDGCGQPPQQKNTGYDQKMKPNALHAHPLPSRAIRFPALCFDCM
jgi:hypothetical protein